MPAICDVDADNVLLRLLLTPEGRADPYTHYRQLRDTAPVLRSSFGPIVLSRYDDCMTALRDPRLGRGTALRAAGGAPLGFAGFDVDPERSEEHTSELQSLMRISYAVFCVKQKKDNKHTFTLTLHIHNPTR